MSAAAEIHALRKRSMAAGAWPAHSVVAWRELAAAAAVLYQRGISPSPLGRLALDLFPEALEEPNAA